MLGFVSGKLEDIDGNLITINCGGVGFEIMVSQTTLSKLGDVGQNVKVFTFLNVKEDEMSLYGFSTKEEKQMFLNLTMVSGVGPKTAISILSEMSLYDLASAIAGSDATAIARVKGIGKKTAERIVLELKERVQNFASLDKLQNSGSVENQEFEYAINVLLTLGLNRYEATKKIRELSAPTDKAEDIIQKVLRSLS